MHTNVVIQYFLCLHIRQRRDFIPSTKTVISQGTYRLSGEKWIGKERGRRKKRTKVAKPEAISLVIFDLLGLYNTLYLANQQR